MRNWGWVKLFKTQKDQKGTTDGSRLMLNINHLILEANFDPYPHGVRYNVRDFGTSCYWYAVVGV